MYADLLVVVWVFWNSEPHVRTRGTSWLLKSGHLTWGTL